MPDGTDGLHTARALSALRRDRALRAADVPGTPVICRSCGLCGSTDRCARPALWLSAATATRHGELWAYNLAHLDLIRRFVAAALRERAPWYKHGRKMTCVARLPSWVKRAT